MKSRVTAIETIVVQTGDDEPFLIDNRWDRELITSEQPFGPRRVSVGDDWTPLDLGWLKDNVGILSVKTLGGGTVELRHRGASGVWRIFSRESLSGCPTMATEIEARCPGGQARIKVSVIPE